MEPNGCLKPGRRQVAMLPSVLALLILVLPFFPFPAAAAYGAEAIAKIAAFKGDVVILTGETVAKVTKAGHPLLSGDRI